MDGEWNYMEQVDFNQWDNENVIDVEIEEDTPLVGVCRKCLGTGYIIQEKDGIKGMLFTSTSNDSEGRPVKRLVPCDCKVRVSY